MTRLVLWDIDGTLLRTGGAGVRAFGQAAERLFNRPGGTAHLRFHGRTDTSLVREFFRAHGLTDTPEARAHFLDGYVFFLEDQLQRQRGEVCPGVLDQLAGMRSAPEPPVMGLLTGNVRLGAALKLAAHGLADEFVLGAFGDDHEDRNQLARIALKRGSQVLGRPLAGAEVLVIGDTRADIECARAIGARCVVVATGGEGLAELLEHSPALALESLTDVSAARILDAGEHWERPADWEALYRVGDTRWDKGQAVPAIAEFLSAHPEFIEAGNRMAVPGCGRGHDARAWAAAGFAVTGLDLAPSAVASARALTPAGMNVTFEAGNFLDDAPQDGAFDALFEHTLFCALPPASRAAYARAVVRWVRPGGDYLAVNYLQPRDEAGPPYGVTVAELRATFEPEFELLKHCQPRSWPGREGRERVFWWRRRI